MKSSDYRKQIKTITKNVMRKKFPGLKQSVLEDAASEIARSIHARFYGADVDGVGSPIWRDHPATSEANRGQPNATAQEILND